MGIYIHRYICPAAVGLMIVHQMLIFLCVYRSNVCACLCLCMKTVHRYVLCLAFILSQKVFQRKLIESAHPKN